MRALSALLAKARARPFEAAMSLLAWLLLAGVIATTTAPLFKDLEAWGGHDWDMVTSFRYLTVKSLREYGQFPFWNPYACGGYPSWGYVESGTNVASPWAPLHFLLPLQVAVRWEVVGTAALSAAGAWALAGRFTRSAALRLFVAGVFALNNRWAMQAATGHLMHSYYAWMPWALYFLDRAIGAGGTSAPRHRDVVYGAVCVAMLVYTGAIYPLPHTLLAIGLYGGLLSVGAGRLRPVAMAALIAAVGLALAAPKLVPTIDAFLIRPREVESTEVMGLDLFVRLLTRPGQDLRAPAARPPQWGWHEWGMYIGWPAAFALALGVLLGRGRREAALKCIGALYVVIAFGAFHELSPWALLHKLPVLRSQHVPSRWLYPAVLLLAVVAAAAFERALQRAGPRRRILESTLLAIAAWVVIDVAAESRRPLSRAFWMRMHPSVAPATASFHQEQSVPRHLHYIRRDWAPPTLPGMIANVGIIECWSVVPMSIFARDAAGHVPGQGARGRGHPDYRGEVYTASGRGTARVVAWSPNAVTAHVTGGVTGDALVLNQNFDPGWQANGVSAFDHAEAVGARLRGGDETIVFRYRPRFLWIGLLIGCAAAVGIAGCALLRRIVTPAPSRPSGSAAAPPRTARAPAR